MSAATLIHHIREFVRFSERHDTLVVDVAVLRKLSGLALPAASKKGYTDFIDNRGDDLIPVWNMVPWFRLEKAELDESDYQALLALDEPIGCFVRAYPKPPRFGSTEFRRADPETKRTIQQRLTKTRWAENRKITPESIKKLLDVLHEGVHIGIAAFEAGMSTSTAKAIRAGTYKHMTPELEAAWTETFGLRTGHNIAPKKKTTAAPEALKLTRAGKDRRTAEFIRRVYVKLEKETKKPRTREDAIRALHLAKADVGKIINSNPSNWGPECSLAWRETFGKEGQP